MWKPPLLLLPPRPLRLRLHLPTLGLLGLSAHRLPHSTHPAIDPPLLSLPSSLLHLSVVLFVLVEKPQLRAVVGWKLLAVQLLLDSLLVDEAADLRIQGLSGAAGFLTRLRVAARCDGCRQVSVPDGGKVARLGLTFVGAGGGAVSASPPQDCVPNEVDKSAEDEEASVNVHGDVGHGLGKGKKGKDKKRKTR